MYLIFLFVYCYIYSIYIYIYIYIHPSILYTSFFPILGGLLEPIPAVQGYTTVHLHLHLNYTYYTYTNALLNLNLTVSGLFSFLLSTLIWQPFIQCIYLGGHIKISKTQLPRSCFPSNMLLLCFDFGVMFLCLHFGWLCAQTPLLPV